MEKIVSPELPKPEYARNMRLLGHTDMGGRPDGQQVMVNQGYAVVWPSSDESAKSLKYLRIR